ncbi:RidA family protein [Paucibacter sp. APW11]|uniref:RidA family protein n=1 Tax=Roseateles aquae TaxID=3077235 RepID=A0ABU3PIM6_9BURK|nr:RidA family protein [Paucibacter sp. APW11]MDT9002408.1 RidA family protein [Paucibacter sp. APW11]
MIKTLFSCALLLTSLSSALAQTPGATPAAAAGKPADVIRHRPAGSTFPIASAVEVPAGRTLVFLSGAVPPVVDDKAERGSLAAYGDTRTQTRGVLAAIERSLKGLGLGMGDVVKMQVFLVGDPALGGKMDFDGFMAAYREQFGGATQPNLPARSVMQVAGLVAPGWLVEIEVTAVR